MFFSIGPYPKSYWAFGPSDPILLGIRTPVTSRNNPSSPSPQARD